MTPILGIVGAGYISRFHFSAFKKLNADLRIVADVNADAAKDAAKPFNAAVTSRWQEVAEHPEVNTVAIFTPTPFHAEVARAALMAGKHVICEKTLSLNAGDSFDLAQLAEQKNRLLFTSYMKRFFPAVQKAKQLMPSLGHIMSVYCRTYQGVAPHNFHTGDLPATWQGSTSATSPIKRATGGGILVCGGSHVFDLLLHLVGKPRQVFAQQFRRPDSDVDLMTHALFEFGNGVGAHFEGNWHPLAAIGFQQSGWDEGFEINGVNGSLILETPVWNEPLRNAPRLRHYDNAAQTWTEYATPVACPFERAEAFFLAQIAANSQGDCDRYVGYRVDYLLDQTQKSATLRQPVALDWKA